MQEIKSCIVNETSHISKEIIISYSYMLSLTLCNIHESFKLLYIYLFALPTQIHSEVLLVSQCGIYIYKSKYNINPRIYEYICVCV